jgi:hypothetical protein
LQTTQNILMIRPVAFGFNEQTAESNAFQDAEFGEANKSTSQTKALAEFDKMVVLLRGKGVNVMVVDDTLLPHTPDSIFPNNWISFHASGEIILYPMQANNRRLERRNDIIEKIKSKFNVTKIIDLSYFESENKFLEGTGSMVLFRPNLLSFACLSPRTNEEVLAKFSQETGFEIIAFTAVDENDKQIYHTNVLMCIGSKFVIICLAAIPDLKEKEIVINKIQSAGLEIIDISFSQMNNFAGNMLEVQNNEGKHLLCMSTTAYNSLNGNQISILEKYTEILHFNINTIERNGGGSVRCMMAEVSLAMKV